MGDSGMLLLLEREKFSYKKLLDFVHNRGNPAIYSLVQSGLSYLDSRVEFWQQQQPMYARKRERELRKWKPAAQRNQKPKKKSYPFPL